MSELIALLEDSYSELPELEQTVFHGHVILQITASFAPEAAERIQKELLWRAHELGLNAYFDDVASAASAIRGETWALTLIRPQLPPSLVALIAKRAEEHGLQVERVRTLARQNAESIELTLREEGKQSREDARRSWGVDALRAVLVELEAEHSVDLALQREGLLRRSKRLVVMDMDSTLIQHEVIDELAREVGAYEAVAEVTHRAMNGEIDFNTALRERCRRLAGAPESVFETVRNRVALTPGARELIGALKRLGIRLAVVSGGFIQVVEPFRDELGLDYAYANELEVKDGRLTGELVGPIVNRQRKGELLVELAERNGIALEQTIAIGDGANDLDMLGLAGLGIAFNAKRNVQLQARFNIKHPRLDTVLYLLGMSDDEVAALMARS